MASSSTSRVDKDKGILGQINAIKKGNRLSASGMVPDVEKKKAKQKGRERHVEGLYARNFPNCSDLWLKSFGIPELLQFEAKYTLIQQD